MEHGLERLQTLPLSLRLIRELHGKLLNSGRGSHLTPGEFRTTQNWIGGSRPGNARFVPPPPEEVMPRMGALEKFLHDDPEPTPLLIKAALAHVQFETIHPFLDGNGRVGRLLITFLLCSSGVLKKPILYLSLYLKRRRQTYYELLQRVRDDGDWEEWLLFFLHGVHDTAEQAVLTAQRILRLFEQDRRGIRDQGGRASSALRVHEVLQQRPVATAADIAEKSGLTPPTVRSCLQLLEHKVQIVREVTGRQRHRVYVYSPYLDILNEGTEPMPHEPE
jgi:Fic family protein